MLSLLNFKLNCIVVCLVTRVAPCGQRTANLFESLGRNENRFK